ncbi:MAG: D-alanyl-D-alanine carboxypeptidase family protein, partial [Sphingorhabdus sp.]
MRILKALVIITVVVTTPVVQARPQYHSAAPVAYMLDMSSGTVLFDQGSDRKIQPASMTKLMTTYVAFDLISRGKLDPGQKIVVRPETWAAWQNTGSTMFLKPNEQVRVSDLLHGVVTLSGNDAAIVLAEGITGSQATFVERMNSTAKRLGMRDSHFETANGWPDQGRTTTTARDLALLGARTIHDFPVLYRQFYGLTRFRWNGIEQPNRNPILGKIDGADGIKTGHTNGAGYCFIGTAEQHGRRLLIVVAGLESSGDRAFESVRFLNWGFKEWRTQQLYKRGSPVTKIPVQLGT